MKRYQFFGLLAAAILLFFASCASSASPEVKKGVDAMTDMLKPLHLQKSAFYVAYPDGTASDYVHYTFSTMGTAEWPPRDNGMEFTSEELKMARIKALPANISIYQDEPDPNDENVQVVIKADESKNVVIFEGYDDPSAGPSLVIEKPLPKVEVDPTAALFFESNREMGIDY